MNIDKRPLYVWIFVLLANLGLILSMVIMFVRLEIPSFIFSPIPLVLIGILLFISVAPVLIAKSNDSRRKYYLYGIPVLLLLPILYSIYYNSTCSSEFSFACGMVPFLITSLSVIFMLIYLSIYRVAKSAIEKDARHILFLIKIESVIIACIVLFATIFNSN